MDPGKHPIRARTRAMAHFRRSVRSVRSISRLSGIEAFAGGGGAGAIVAPRQADGRGGLSGGPPWRVRHQPGGLLRMAGAGLALLVRAGGGIRCHGPSETSAGTARRPRPTPPAVPDRATGHSHAAHDDALRPDAGRIPTAQPARSGARVSTTRATPARVRMGSKRSLPRAAQRARVGAVEFGSTPCIASVRDIERNGAQ